MPPCFLQFLCKQLKCLRAPITHSLRSCSAIVRFDFRSYEPFKKHRPKKQKKLPPRSFTSCSIFFFFFFFFLFFTVMGCNALSAGASLGQPSSPSFASWFSCFELALNPYDGVFVPPPVSLNLVFRDFGRLPRTPPATFPSSYEAASTLKWSAQ